MPATLSSWEKRFLSFLILLGWMGVIFFFSSQPGDGQPGPPPLWYLFERKLAHVTEYALLLLATFAYFRLLFYRESLVGVLVLSSAFALMYGATDELHQFFVLYRGAQLPDVAIDGVGIFLAALTVWVLHNQNQKPAQKVGRVRTTRVTKTKKKVTSRSRRIV